MYDVVFSDEALKGARKLRKSSLAAYNKLESLIPELEEHPYTGTGHPEQLRYIPEMWSRRLDKKNRVRYTVNENIVEVYVVDVMGHYEDK